MMTRCRLKAHGNSCATVVSTRPFVRLVREFEDFEFATAAFRAALGVIILFLCINRFEDIDPLFPALAFRGRTCTWLLLFASTIWTNVTTRYVLLSPLASLASLGRCVHSIIDSFGNSLASAKMYVSANAVQILSSKELPKFIAGRSPVSSSLPLPNAILTAFWETRQTVKNCGNISASIKKKSVHSTRY